MTRPRKLRAKVTYRTIGSGDQIPTGTPGRFRSAHGYMRLRWKVGKYEYVEAYEHRLIAGLPDGHVHHRDEDKANNQPGNLEVLSAAEHSRHHSGTRVWKRGYRIPTARRWTLWDGCVGESAFQSRRRRVEREQRRAQSVDRIVELYASGLTTTEVGAVVGIAASNVSIALHQRGITTRNRWTNQPSIDSSLVARWHAEGVRAAEMKRRLGIGYKRLYAVFDQLGLPRFGPGRPSPTWPAADGSYSDSPPGDVA